MLALITNGGAVVGSKGGGGGVEVTAMLAEDTRRSFSFFLYHVFYPYRWSLLASSAAAVYGHD